MVDGKYSLEKYNSHIVFICTVDSRNGSVRFLRPWKQVGRRMLRPFFSRMTDILTIQDHNIQGPMRRSTSI